MTPRWVFSDLVKLMKLTFAIFGVAPMLTANVMAAGTDAIIKQRAREVSNQNNVRQGVAPPTQPSQPPATAPAQTQTITRLQTDLAAIKAAAPVTVEQKQKITTDLIAAAQSAKPSSAVAAKLAEDLLAAFAAKPLSTASLRVDSWHRPGVRGDRGVEPDGDRAVRGGLGRRVAAPALAPGRELVRGKVA